MQVDLNDLQNIRDALSDVVGYLTDTSCSDPDCCGGPFYEKTDFELGCKTLENYGLKYVESNQ